MQGKGSRYTFNFWAGSRDYQFWDASRRRRKRQDEELSPKEDRFKMIPDIVVVGITTDDLCDKVSRVMTKCEANREPTLLKDIIGLQTFTILKGRTCSKKRDDDKHQAKIRNTVLSASLLRRKGIR